MKIRTSLVLACFLLSVVPLGVIVVYSYYASRTALESAYHAEATRLTAQMDRRLGNIRDELQQRLAEVSALPKLSEGNVLMTMGDTASLVDSLEIQPVHPAPHPAVPAPPAPPATMVIRIPPVRVPRFAFTDAQRAQLKRISELGHQMGSSALTTEQHNELQKQLTDAQNVFSQSMQEAQKEFGKSLEATMKQQEKERQAAMDAAERRREAGLKAVEHQREIAEDATQRREEAAKDAADQQAEAAKDAADQRAEAAQNAQEQAAETQRQNRAALVLGQRFNVPMTESGAVVGHLQAHVSTERIVHRILSSSPEGAEDRNEIAFAVDREGNVYTRSEDERQRLDKLGVLQRIAAGKPLNDIHNWIVVLRKDPQSGLQIGVARPFGEDLEGLRKTAAKNFGYGIALIFVALIGIVPVANHITGDVELVTSGAERIAHGDLTTRLPVQSKNEIGQLAAAFNRMAEDLSLQQQRIVEQERAAIEYERKSAELEEARRFQLSMLPKEVPRLDGCDIAVFTHTATEVGGDYYDFHVEGDGVSVTVGDATGHGASAGTMVVVIKALFAGYSGNQSPAQFLRDATEKVRRMELGRMAMALMLARFQGRQVTIASAGMPPAYIHRRDTNSVEEISLGATPLGTLGDDYRDAHVQLALGDTMLLMSDGFPELMNAAGQQLGYGAAAEAFAAAAKAEDANAVIAVLAETARRWHGEPAPNDDVTFVVVRAV